MEYDTLVIGSGISGMESAIKLGDMGYRVLLVEKEASIGGKMILLSKVFPTLDCASCISTPKMAAAIHHPNVTALTYAEVEKIRKLDGRFQVEVVKHPRFVDEAACTGCQQCETACTVSVPDQFNSDLVARHAAYIPFPQAVPKKAVLERAGTSPCTETCPAGVKAHGYVSLARSGEYEKAFQLVLQSTPLVGTLGRACFAPCESECSRGSLEGPVSIRRIKRYIADDHYDAHRRLQALPEITHTERVAIVGSGPAGLTAAWQLAHKGYPVTIFEAEDQAGGALWTIPAYRLPSAVIGQDLDNLRQIGVSIRTNTPVHRIEDLFDQGFSAIVLAVGTTSPVQLLVAGAHASHVDNALHFLKAVKTGVGTRLEGMTVAVVGGGNVAIDSARSALRLGARVVRLISLESREAMPAFSWEVEEAEQEGVFVLNGWGVESIGESELHLMGCDATLDREGRFDPQYDRTRVQSVPADRVIVAAGMRPATEAWQSTLTLAGGGRIAVESESQATSWPGVFAAGDAVSGPTSIAEAAGAGKKAAEAVEAWLSASAFSPGPMRLPRVSQEEVLARQSQYALRPPRGGNKALVLHPHDFTEVEPALTESEVRDNSGRCLDCGVCSECQECVAACPADAIHLDAREERFETTVDSVIIATGFKLFAADRKPLYGFGRFKNVITGMQMDRLLAPTRPYHTVLRPGDGKVPESIAYIMCTGSRDQTVGNPLCSKICCMYSNKQNQLIMGALPLADVTVYDIDMRTTGKGYEEFYVQTRAMGTTFIKGRIAEIVEKNNGNLVVRYEDIDHGGQILEQEHDLVVLAVGVQPNHDVERFFEPGVLEFDDYAYVNEADEILSPGQTNVPGVYVAGTAAGAKDIPESILHAGSAVAQASAYIEGRRLPV